MSYLDDERVAELFDAACEAPEVVHSLSAFRAAWKPPLPPREITPSLCAYAVFVRPPMGEISLLAEEDRTRANDVAKWQLVFVNHDNDSGDELDIFTFDNESSARAALDSLASDDEDNDDMGVGGGLIFHGGEVLADRRFDNGFFAPDPDFQRHDFVTYFELAKEGRRSSAEEIAAKELEAVRDKIVDVLSRYTAMAPRLIEMHSRYAESITTRPVVFHRHPTVVLNEYARLFPEHYWAVEPPSTSDSSDDLFQD